MSLIPLAAELIRRAAADENYAQDLHSAVQDKDAFDGLVHGGIVEPDLGWLAPSEWLWLARWRQGMGGRLDALLLDYLEFAISSRSARYELRGLVMRDPLTDSLAARTSATDPELDDVGLRWLRAHSQEFPDPLEVARDALQYATEAAWFTLRVLTSLGHQRGEQVRQELAAFASERELGGELPSRWTEL